MPAVTLLFHQFLFWFSSPSFAWLTIHFNLSVVVAEVNIGVSRYMFCSPIAPIRNSFYTNHYSPWDIRVTAHCRVYAQFRPFPPSKNSPSTHVRRTTYIYFPIRVYTVGRVRVCECSLICFFSLFLFWVDPSFADVAVLAMWWLVMVIIVTS